MRFLNPKTDFVFKKIFGSDSSRDILISFLNAVLTLTGSDTITDLAIIDPRLAPKIDGMKDSFLDVRVRDQRGYSYIIEMQVLNVEGFEKRVLFNASKAYVNQLDEAEPYRILTAVVALTITDFSMFPDLSHVVSRFRLCAEENPAICHQDLELVFAELPKFTKSESELETTVDRWLFFLKHAVDLTIIPESLAAEPAIVRALGLASMAGWTKEELDLLQKREWWLDDQRYLFQKARKVQEVEQKLQDSEARFQDSEARLQDSETHLREARMEIKKAETKAQAEGALRAKADALIRLLERRFHKVPDAFRERISAADADQLDAWLDAVLEAPTIEALFDRQ